MENIRPQGGLCRSRVILRGSGGDTAALTLTASGIEGAGRPTSGVIYMKTQNFVLEWFRHQARQKADKARLLFAPQPLEVQPQPGTPWRQMDENLKLADPVPTRP